MDQVTPHKTKFRAKRVYRRVELSLKRKRITFEEISLIKAAYRLIEHYRKAGLSFTFTSLLHYLVWEKHRELFPEEPLEIPGETHQ